VGYSAQDGRRLGGNIEENQRKILADRRRNQYLIQKWEARTNPRTTGENTPRPQMNRGTRVSVPDTKSEKKKGTRCGVRTNRSKKGPGTKTKRGFSPPRGWPAEKEKGGLWSSQRGMRASQEKTWRRRMQELIGANKEGWRRGAQG